MRVSISRIFSFGVRFVQRLGLVVFGFLLSLFLLEVVAQIIPLWPDRLFQPDERFGWTLIPNTNGWFINPRFPFEVRNKVAINSRGLNDREYSYQVTAGIFRVLLLGDSFAAALELPRDQSFHEIAERCLNKSFGIPAEIINTGVNAYATDNELLFYLFEGYRYQPDLVLLAFHPNDVAGNHPSMAPRYFEKPYYTFIEGKLELRNFPVAHHPEPDSLEAATFFESIKRWFHLNSKFYNFIGVMIKSDQLENLGNFLVRMGLMDSFQTDQPGEQPQDSVFSLEYTPEWVDAWAITKELIIRLREETRIRGSEFAVVIVTDYRQLITGDQADVDFARLKRLLADFLEYETIPYLDLYPALLNYQTNSSVPLHIPNDGHWTVAGHQQAGKEICAWLQKQISILQSGDHIIKDN